MKVIADKIYKELCEKNIDWKNMESLIESLGDSINSYDDWMEETILSEAYKSNQKDGSVNLYLTELFLKHGFDVRGNGGQNGASCLRALCWSSYDKYVLHIAELLLKLGADSSLGYKDDDVEERGVLGCISWKFGYWMIGEYDVANMFVAYYEMVSRAQKGKSFVGIRAFRDAVGETVSRVEKIKVRGLKGDEIRTSFILHCGKKELLVSDCVEFYINPYEREEVLEIVDVSDEYSCLIGTRVKGLRYFNASLAKLNFSNGLAILISSNDSKSVNESKNWFRIVKSGGSMLPEKGSQIADIRLCGELQHAENSTFYREHTIILRTGEAAYALYAHASRNTRASVRAEKLDKDFVRGKRGIVVHNLILKHIEYASAAIKWLSFECDEGILYIVPDRFTDIAMYLSESEVEDVLCVGYNTKGLKKIQFTSKE